MRRLAWSILFLLPIAASATEVYRSIDAKGRITYSDRPGEATEVVVVRPTVSTFARSRAQGSDDGKTEPTAADDASGTESATSETPEISAAVKERNCEVARERAETYSMSRRLFRTLPDGEREYLSDSEIDEARAKAQSDVANWCG